MNHFIVDLCIQCTVQMMVDHIGGNGSKVRDREREGEKGRAYGEQNI